MEKQDRKTLLIGVKKVVRKQSENCKKHQKSRLLNSKHKNLQVSAHLEDQSSKRRRSGIKEDLRGTSRIKDEAGKCREGRSGQARGA